MLDKIAWYTPSFLIVSLWILTWRFSDWRNWRKYYPTILFIILFSLFTFVLTCDYPLWLYHDTLFSPNRMISEFRLDFLLFPAIILLYLTFYPYASGMLRQLTYIAIWGIVWSLIEAFYVFLKILTYHNGWNIWWTVVVWFTMFTLIAIHHRKPMLALLIHVIFSLFAINYFNIPFTNK
jgi:hypothetical protein